MKSAVPLCLKELQDYTRHFVAFRLEESIFDEKIKRGERYSIAQI